MLYNAIGTGYNTTRQADPYIAARLYDLLLPQASGLYLDIGCGTGNYTMSLAEKGIAFCGVEPSETMLQEARRKTDRIMWLPGLAEHIPAQEKTFSGAIATLTIHHWTDLEQAFQEIFRVLIHGSRLVIFTATSEQMQHYWLHHYFPAMMRDSMAQMPSFENIQKAYERAGFTIVAQENYVIHDSLKDLFLYAGKDKPELYFNEEVRKGISSFSALANSAEVRKGLIQLRLDIDNGEFFRIRERNESDLGDYMFIVAEK